MEPWREGGSAVRGTDPDPDEETRHACVSRWLEQGTASALMLMASVLVVMMALPVAAHTTGVERMKNAEWTCLDFEEIGIHCFNEPSAALFNGESPTTVHARVFMVDQDEHETYLGTLGTELLIRADVFERNPNRERPCPQEGGDWHDLRETFELPYYGCHHFA